MMQKIEITFVSGLYFYTRNGKTNYPIIIPEIEQSLEINTWYRDKLVCYADSIEIAEILQKKGLYVHKVFDDAPKDIVYDSAHKMKHWIMLNAVKEFKNVVWIDWDTYSIKPIDDFFYNRCFESNTPKFTLIKNYWAVVNCAVYYLNEDYIPLMEQSFQSFVSEPNDELLWKSVLPENICSLPHFWLNDLVINIWDESDFNQVTDNTYLLHLKNFEMLKKMTSVEESFIEETSIFNF